MGKLALVLAGGGSRGAYQIGVWQALREMGVCNLYACIACPEQEDEYPTRSSMEFHEHLGFRQAGLFRECGYKFGRWYHMVWMEKLIGAHRAAQPPVRPYRQ